MTFEMFQWELKSRETGTTVKVLRQPELLNSEILLPNLIIKKEFNMFYQI